jgi:hypothetical protein
MMSGGEEPVAMKIWWLQRSGGSGEESWQGYTILSSTGSTQLFDRRHGERAETSIKATFRYSQRDPFDLMGVE